MRRETELHQLDQLLQDMSVLPSETLETAAMTLEPSVHELLLARRQQVVGGHVDALLDVWDLEEDHPRPRPTKRHVRRRRHHVAMLERRGVLLFLATRPEM